MLILFTYFFSITFPNYTESNAIMFDVFFILMFGFFVAWMKPKEFQYQKVGGDVWASPYVLLLNKLPISKDVIVKSRFVIYFIYAIPFQLLLLVFLYMAPSFREAMSISTYISFSIIWLSFSIYFGCSIAVSDAGDSLPLTKHIAYIVLFFIVFGLILSLFYKVLGFGIVYWTIHIAENWHITSALVSLLLAGIGFQYWQKYMLKSIGKRDYFK